MELFNRSESCQRRLRFRSALVVTAGLLVTILASGALGRVPTPGSSNSPQDSPMELERLIEGLRSENVASRGQAEASLMTEIARIGKDGLRYLRDQEERTTDLEVKARLRSVLRQLQEPRVRWISTLMGAAFGACAPVVDERVCIFADELSVCALETATGTVLWKAPGERTAFRALTAEAVFLPVCRGAGVGIQALRPLSGEKLWFHGIADLWDPLPEKPEIYYHDAGFALSGPWLYTGTRAGKLLCLDSATGARRWTSDPLEPGSEVGQPLVLNGTVYAARENEALVAWDAKTGKLLWEAVAPGIGGRAPMAQGERLFVVTFDVGKGPGKIRPEDLHGECIAFSPKDGGRIWTMDLASFGMGAVGLLDVGSTLVVQSKTHLLGLSSDSGAVQWSIPCARFGSSTLARDKRGRVYAGADDGTLRVVDASSGRELLRFDPNTLPETVGAHKVQYGDGKRLPDLGSCGSPTVLGRDVFLMMQSGLSIAVRIPEFMGEGK